jgi:hypothetical protein
VKLEATDLRELQPVIAAIVRETLEQVSAADKKLNGRLAYTEPEAAQLLGIERHNLRDARLRGELMGSRVGKRILYSTDELRRFLTGDQQKTKARSRESNNK